MSAAGQSSFRIDACLRNDAVALGHFVLHELAELLRRGTDGHRPLVAERCLRIATKGEVVATDGSVVEARAGSLCVHGDTPGAVDMAAAVRRGLEAAGVEVTPFVGRSGP